MKTSTRNPYVDVLRGIAILLVVLGHTITGCTKGSQDSFLYNVIWALQMPLFFLISGFVTKYSRGCINSQSLRKYIFRRSLAYLLPWAVWSFIIRGFIHGENAFLDLSCICWNMDSGYWFLFSIWTISICFGLSEFTAIKLFHTKTMEIFATSFILALFGLLLFVIGQSVGMNFLGIKLTIYYIPFYWLGYLYSKFGDTFSRVKFCDTLNTILIALSTIVWIYFMYNVSLYKLPDNGISVFMRIICSLSGCISVCGLCKGALCIGRGGNRIVGYLQWSGNHSLEVYLGQYLMLNILMLGDTPSFMTVKGILLSTANFIITMVLLTVVILLTNQNKFLRFILYGKTN